MLSVPPPKLMQLIRMGSRVADLLRLGRRGRKLPAEASGS
jgi:hypothetical protein